MIKFLKTIFIMSISGTAVFGQYLPVTGDKQVTIGMLGTSGTSGMLMLRKFKTETMCNRYGVTFAYSDNYTATPSSGYTESANSSSINAAFSFGKQKNFNIGERFSPYLALDAGINFSNTGSKSQSLLVDTTQANADLNSNSRLLTSSSSNTQITLNPGVFVNPVIGFNYYIAKNFALGAECRFNVLSVKYTYQQNTTHKESTSVKNEPFYDGNGNVVSYDKVYSYSNTPDKKTHSNGFSVVGSITPQFYITASFYFK